MIVLSFDLDQKGRPVVVLFATPSASRIAALEAAGESSPSPIETRALVDTGAGRTFVQASLLRRLDLDSLGVGHLHYHTLDTEGMPKAARLFALQPFFAGVPGGLLTADLEVAEVEDLSGLGVDMLLGRDVLDQCLLFYAGPERRFTLAFGTSPI
jgi:hypothetical protein